jgi:hypothetical protein|tara:strand:+ start:885 stop:1226 length:342 start_codon:yes stop_codon:yes gene_type:complete
MAASLSFRAAVAPTSAMFASRTTVRAAKVRTHHRSRTCRLRTIHHDTNLPNAFDTRGVVRGTRFAGRGTRFAGRDTEAVTAHGRYRPRNCVVVVFELQAIANTVSHRGDADER